MQEPEIKRWTAKRKAELIRQIYKGQLAKRRCTQRLGAALPENRLRRVVRSASRGDHPAISASEVTDSGYIYAHPQVAPRFTPYDLS